VVAVNGAWLALQAGVKTGHAHDWNIAWRTFRSALGGISRTEERTTGFQAMVVARLRRTALRYPADSSLVELVDELRSTSRPFDTLWRAPRIDAPQENRAVFRHPDAGDITVDGTVLEVPGDDLLATVLTAAPGSTDAARLDEIVSALGKPAVVRVGQVGPG
jgi:transcription regulator MmyB-like protein